MAETRSCPSDEKESAQTWLSKGSVCTHRLDSRSQSFTVWSAEPVANRGLLGWKSQQVIQYWWSTRLIIFVCCSTSIKVIWKSSETEHSIVPSLLNAKPRTVAPWSSSFFNTFPVYLSTKKTYPFTFPSAMICSEIAML